MCTSPAAFNVFLSYVANQDGEVVADVAALLEDRSLSCFYASRDIPDARKWLPTVEAALLRCDALVAFVREEFKMSGWTDQEVGYALGRERHVITVMMSPNWQSYGFFGAIQAVTCETTATGIADRIYNALWQDEENYDSLVGLLLNSLHSSRQRDELRSAANQLRTLDYVAASTADCIASAMELNPVLRSDNRIRRVLKQTILNASASKEP